MGFKSQGRVFPSKRGPIEAKTSIIRPRRKTMLKTKNVKPVLLGFVFATTFGLGVTKAHALDNQANNQWVRGSLEDGSYCHLKFPAIRQSTLYTDHPQLKSASSGDMVDYYG